MRPCGRGDNEVRPLSFERGFTSNPGGSVLVRWGNTWVLCTASIEKGVPPFLFGSGKGWLTAEYSMLPGSTKGRKSRDISRLKLDGRSAEIQRLIGRSLRASVDLNLLPERTLWIDCDVLQADGGTRCAAITGAWLAVHDAVAAALEAGDLKQTPIVETVAAVSVGVLNGKPLVDLSGREDQVADVDMNLVMTGRGEFVEIQGSAERGTFPSETLERLLAIGRTGFDHVHAVQQAAIEA